MTYVHDVQMCTQMHAAVVQTCIWYLFQETFLGKTLMSVGPQGATKFDASKDKNIN